MEQREADRRLRERLAQTGQQVGAADINTSSEATGRLTSLATYIAGLKKRGHKRPLRQIIVGTPVGGTAKRPGRVASALEYELALDLAVNGKLSAVNRRRALQLGILNPEDL